MTEIRLFTKGELAECVKNHETYYLGSLIKSVDSNKGETIIYFIEHSIKLKDQFISVEVI